MNDTVNSSNQHEIYLQFINAKASIPLIPTRLRRRKSHSIAKLKDNNFPQKDRNLKLEVAYTGTLKKVKLMFARSAHPIFERDYRSDNSESTYGMHAYLTNSFYFFLECDANSNYQVDFAIQCCPYEKEIRELLKAFPFGIHAREVMLKPDFNSFYLNVLKAQDAKHITYR